MSADPDLSSLSAAAWAICFASLPEVGPARLRRLVGLADPERAWRAVLAGRDPGLSRWTPALGATWTPVARSIDPLGVLDHHRAAGIAVTTFGSSEYPSRLQEDPDHPALLCWRGTPVDPERVAVAIVGTRRCTAYGRHVARMLGADLARAGIVVVSGLAAGIDAEAHVGSLSAGGNVVGVVAGGLDHPYPTRNRPLFDRVAREGWLVAEAPLGVAPQAWRFPLRNRIIAALSDLVVVVESGARGGSLHTVDEAAKRDVPVMAVPGSVTSDASLGTNALLADGCAPCRGIDDVITALSLRSLPIEPPTRSSSAAPSAVPSSSNPRGAPSPPPETLGTTARVLLEALGWDRCPIDELVHRTGSDVAAVAIAVAELLDHGVVRVDDGLIERLP